MSQDGKRKVEIFQRSNGTFGFEEWAFDAGDKAWCPTSRGTQIPIVDTLEHALAEASGRVSWARADG